MEGNENRTCALCQFNRCSVSGPGCAACITSGTRSKWMKKETDIACVTCKYLKSPRSESCGACSSYSNWDPAANCTSCVFKGEHMIAPEGSTCYRCSIETRDLHYPEFESTTRVSEIKEMIRRHVEG